MQNRIEIQQMTHAERYIIESYSGIFENLSPTGKLELLEKLAKSLKKDIIVMMYLNVRKER